MDFLFAGAVLPVLGKTVRINEEGEDSLITPRSQQHGDGGMRHTVPLVSYFPRCGADSTLMARETPGGGVARNSCDSTVPHGNLQQLFVIVSTPYAGKDEFPVFDPTSYKRGSRQITKGTKVLERLLVLLYDTPFRADMAFMLDSNETLRFQSEASKRFKLVNAAAPDGMLQPVVRSYNVDPVTNQPKPYEIGLVAPQIELANPADPLSFTPQMVARQLYCGCLAADQMMVQQFGQESMADACSRRFPPKASKKGKLVAPWTAETCSTVQ
jgi:hypothetical protein